MSEFVICPDCGNFIRGDPEACATCRELGVAKKVPYKSSFHVSPQIQNIVSTLLVLFLLALIGSHYDFIYVSSAKRLAGILAPNEPRQTPPTNRPWKKDDYVFTALANYDITARVLLKQNYWLSGGADIAPIDLTLAWGELSDQKNLDRLTISSCPRCYRWSAADLPLPEEEINRSIANTHLVPKDDRVKHALDKIIPGNVVRLVGKLVGIARIDGWHWESSLTREDSGDGACEVMWVDEVKIVRP